MTLGILFLWAVHERCIMSRRSYGKFSRLIVFRIEWLNCTVLPIVLLIVTQNLITSYLNQLFAIFTLIAELKILNFLFTDWNIVLIDPSQDISSQSTLFTLTLSQSSQPNQQIMRPNLTIRIILKIIADHKLRLRFCIGTQLNVLTRNTMHGFLCFGINITNIGQVHCKWRGTFIFVCDFLLFHLILLSL